MKVTKQNTVLISILLISMLFTLLLLKSSSADSFDLTNDLMKSTFMIHGISKKDRSQYKSGTVFILGKPYGKPDKDNKQPAHYVLVTADHVLDGIAGKSANLILRKPNGTGYKKYEFPIKIRKYGNPLWTTHDRVDLAVMYVDLPGNLDIDLISYNLLASFGSIEGREINLGKDVRILGYPYRLSASGDCLKSDDCIPLLRKGNIASKISSLKNTFMVDFEVFPGNSGGPVFFYDPDWKGSDSFNPLKRKKVRFILGLVTQNYYLSDENLPPGQEPKQTEIVHMGIGVVIPSPLIKELIDSLPAK